MYILKTLGPVCCGKPAGNSIVFVCLEFFVPLDHFSLIWRRQIALSQTRMERYLVRIIGLFHIDNNSSNYPHVL